MRSASGVGLILWALLGCHSPEEAVQPLPPGAEPPPFAVLRERIQQQVQAAQEFFYQDEWSQVEKAGFALKQSGELLPHAQPDASGQPDSETARKWSRRLTSAADSLLAAAADKDALKTTQAFQQLLLLLRDMRPKPLRPTKPD